MEKFVAKLGTYGTLYRYVIRYTDKYDDCCPVMTWHTWAYNLEDAEMRFDDSCEADGDDGWKIVSLARVLDSVSQHRAVQHLPTGRQ